MAEKIEITLRLNPHNLPRIMINPLNPDYSALPGRRPISALYKAAEHNLSDVVDISIITPYFNTEELFVETVISLKNQSMQNWEWLIVDDGSTDVESIERLADVAANDPRIKVIRQPNSGPGAARNTAYRNTKGRYVCLLDSDDMIEPTYLEKCVWFLESNPEFSFCNSYSVVFGDQEYLWTTGFERGKAHLHANSGPPISVIRRLAYSDCGGFDETIRFGHEDWDFWLAMAKAGHWGYTIPEYLQWYRKHGNGRFERIMRAGDVNAQFEKMIRRKYAGLEHNFPEPLRRQPLPYETVETTIPVANPLVANTHGRRIMFIIPWMVTGGADRVNLDLVEGLTAGGHDVTVCATLATNHCWEYLYSHFSPDIFILPNILHQSDYPRFLSYLIQSRQIDTVVITGSTIGYQLLPYLRASSPDVAFLDMCHVEEPHWLNGGHPRFGVGYQDTLDLNIVTTKHLAEWMQLRGADSTRIRVMHTGVRMARATPSADVRQLIRADLNIPAGVAVIVFAGRICEQKRPAMLAEILKGIRDQGLLFRALVIGDGELRDRLEGLLDQHQLIENVQMLGSVSHQRWLDILIASDILLMPSQYEGISIALLEAMAAGVVPVVAKVGGQDEIVTTDAGVLVPHGDNEDHEYVEAIRRLISNPGELQQMSKQCKTLAASELSWDGMIANFLGLLDEAHHFRVEQPRIPISLSFGRELASQSLECNRLGVAADWLWNSSTRSATPDTALRNMSAEAQAVAKFAILLSQTRLGRMITRSQFLKIAAKRLMRIAKPSSTPYV